MRVIVNPGGNCRKGVQFVVDEHGNKTAVVINLKHYSELWEDFYDCAVAQSRKNEPRESLQSVKKRLMTRGKIRSNESNILPQVAKHSYIWILILFHVH
jgi:hypothetical protein